MSLIDEVMKDVAESGAIYDEHSQTHTVDRDDTPLSTLSDDQVEEMLQVKLNKANEKQLETEKLLNMANTDIERLERENTHLRETLKQYTLKASDTKLRALVDKFVEKAKEYKIQSPIIRK